MKKVKKQTFSDLEKFLKENPPQKFIQHVYIDQENGVIELALEDVSCHHEWIKGEGSDISIWRANDDNRVVGVRLPLRNWKGRFSIFYGSD